MTTFAGTDCIIALKEVVHGLEACANSNLSFGVSSSGNVDHLQSVGVFSEDSVDMDSVNFVKISGPSSRPKALAAGNFSGPVYALRCRTSR